MELTQILAAFVKDAAALPGTALITLLVALSFVGIGLYLARIAFIGRAAGGRWRVYDRAALFGGAAHFFVGYFLLGLALAESAPDAAAAVASLRLFPGHMIGLFFWWLFVLEVTTALQSRTGDSGLRRLLIGVFNLPRSPVSIVLVAVIAVLVTLGQVFPYSDLGQAFELYPKEGPAAQITELLPPGEYYWVELLAVAALMTASFAHLLPLWWEQRNEQARKVGDRTTASLFLGAFCLMAGALFLGVNIILYLGMPDEIGILFFMVGVFLTGHALHVNHGLRIGGAYRKRFAWPIVLGPISALAVLLLLVLLGETDLEFQVFAVFALATSVLVVFAYGSDHLRTTVAGGPMMVGAGLAHVGDDIGHIDEIEEGKVSGSTGGTGSSRDGAESSSGATERAGSSVSVGGRLAVAADERPGRDILSQPTRVVGLELVRPVLRHYRNHAKITSDVELLLELDLVSQQREPGESRVDALKRVIAGLVEMEKPLPFPKQVSKILASLEPTAETSAIQRYVAIKYWWLMYVPHNHQQRDDARSDLYTEYDRARASGDHFTTDIVDRLIEISAMGNRGRAVLRKWREAGCVEIARRLQRREAEARLSAGEDSKVI